MILAKLFIGMCVILLALATLAQDTLTVFDPVTYEESTYIMNYDKGVISQTVGKAKDRKDAECYIMTIGITPLFHGDGKAPSRVMTSQELQNQAKLGIGLLTYDRCMDSGKLDKYEVVVYYSNMQPARLIKTQFAEMVREGQSLGRLFNGASKVEITNIHIAQTDGGTIQLPEVVIKIGETK